jgi:hypothetical protein
VDELQTAFARPLLPPFLCRLVSFLLKGAAKRRQQQLENEVREYHVSVMGDRWAAVGNNRLSSSWRVVLHINDAMCAGVSGWRMIAPR